MFIETKSQQIISVTADNPLVVDGLGWRTGGFRQLGGTRSYSYSQLYRQQLWVFVCNNKLSRGLARIGLKSYQEVAGSPKKLGTADHEFARLMARPYQGGSAFTFVNAIVHTYGIYGRAPVWKNRNGNPGAAPVELVPMAWEHLSVRRDRDGGLMYYVWSEPGTGTKWKLLPEDVMMFGYAGGVSPLEPLATTLQIEDAAQRSTKAFYENGSRPSGVLTTDARYSVEQVRELEEQIEADHAGVDNSFRVAVLANVPGAKWQPFQMSANDAETINHRKLAREECAAAYDIPPPIIGILDRATFSNIDTQKQMWIVDTLGPHAVMFEDVIDTQLVQSEPAFQDCYVKFNMSDMLRGMPAERADAYMKWLQSGTRTPNELRALEDLPRIDDPRADGVYVPTNLAALGTLDDAPAAQSFGYDLDNAIITIDERRAQMGLDPMEDGRGQLTVPEFLRLYGADATDEAAGQ